MSEPEYQTNGNKFIDDDMTPRNVPQPTMNVVQEALIPCVPEVTIVFDSRNGNANDDTNKSLSSTILPKTKKLLLKEQKQITEIATVSVDVNAKFTSTSSQCSLCECNKKEKKPYDESEANEHIRSILQKHFKPKPKNQLDRIEESVAKMHDLYKNSIDKYEKHMLSFCTTLDSSFHSAIQAQNKKIEYVLDEYAKRMKQLHSPILKQRTFVTSDKSIQCDFEHCSLIAKGTNTPSSEPAEKFKIQNLSMFAKDVEKATKKFATIQKPDQHPQNNHQKTEVREQIAEERFISSDRSLVMDVLRKKYLFSSGNSSCKRFTPRH